MKAYRFSRLFTLFILFSTPVLGQVSLLYSPSSVCKNATFQFPQTTNYNGGGTFVATPAGLSISSISGSINPATSTAGIYTVSINCSSCTPIPSTTIEIVAIPSPPTVSGNSVCASGQQYTLTASSSDPNMTFNWIPYGAGQTQVLPVSSANQNFTLVGTVNGCTSQVVSSTSTIAAIQPVISGTNQVCLGSAVSLTATGSGITSFTWSSGPNTAVMTDTPSTNTSYTVETSDANGCIGKAVRTVSVNMPPVVSIIASPSVCAGFGYTLTASGNATLFSWNGGPATNNPSYSNIPTNNPTTYTVVGSLKGCTVLATWDVTIYPIPMLSILPTTPTICAGVPFTFTATGASQYTWMNNNSEVANTYSTTMFFQTIISVAGLSSNGCGSILNKSFQVTALPSFAVPSSPTLCSGRSATVSAIGNAQTYTWSNGFTGNPAVLAPDTTTEFNVKGFRNGCFREQTFTITVNKTPTVTVAGTTVCAGKSTTLEAISTASEDTYKWSHGPTTATASTPSLNTTTNYTVTAESPSSGCKGNAVVTVTVLPSPVPIVSFSYNGPYCSANDNPLPVLSPSFATGGQFSSVTDLPVSGATGEVILQHAAYGMHTVTYVIEEKGCVKSNTSTATLLINPSIKLTAPKIVQIYQGQTIALSHSGGATLYEWSPADNLDCSTCEVPSASPSKPTLYCVTSKQQCVTGVCIFVDILCNSSGDYSMPSAFTPNKDGRNDKFCVQGWSECNEEFDIKIFDRWGEMVYQTQDPNFCWDGNFNGDLLPSGVYMYVIAARFGKDAPFRKTGNITLIR